MELCQHCVAPGKLLTEKKTPLGREEKKTHLAMTIVLWISAVKLNRK